MKFHLRNCQQFLKCQGGFQNSVLPSESVTQHFQHITFKLLLQFHHNFSSESSSSLYLLHLLQVSSARRTLTILEYTELCGLNLCLITCSLHFNKALALLNFIGEVLASNLGRDTRYSECFSGFPQFLEGKFLYNILNKPRSLPSIFFRFITYKIIPLSSLIQSEILRVSLNKHHTNRQVHELKNKPRMTDTFKLLLKQQVADFNTKSRDRQQRIFNKSTYVYTRQPCKFFMLILLCAIKKSLFVTVNTQFR